MTSLFAELERLATDAVDTLYGEPVRIERKVGGEFFSGSADSSRPEITVIGIVDLSPMVVAVQDESSTDGFQPTLAGEKIHVSFDEERFATADEKPRENDILVAATRPNSPRFRVSRIDPDGIGRFVCVCQKA